MRAPALSTYLQPEAGPHRSVAETPELAPGAARRTTSTDLIRSGGFLDPVTADVRARTHLNSTLRSMADVHGLLASRDGDAS